MKENLRYEDVCRSRFEYIEIGDEVFWENPYLFGNRDIYWKVTEKNDKEKMLKIEPTMGEYDTFWIWDKDIKYTIPTRGIEDIGQ